MRDFLGKRELCEESGISVRTWERIIAAGEVDCVRVGRRLVVPRASFESFMTRHTTKAKAPIDIREQLKRLAERALGGTR